MAAILRIKVGGNWIDVPAVKGTSAYESAVAAGYTGTELEFQTLLYNIPELAGTVAGHTTQLADIQNYDIYDLAYIKDGKLVANKDHITAGVIAKYTCVDLGEAAQIVKCKCRFVGGASAALVANNSGMWAVTDITSNSVHIVFTPNRVAVQIFQNGSNIEVTSIPHATAPLDTTGATEYEFGWSISGDTMTIYRPNGDPQTVTDARFAPLNGKYVVFEHFSAGVTEQSYPRVEFSYFYAKGATYHALTDSFLRKDGTIGIAPTGHVYAQFRNV